MQVRGGTATGAVGISGCVARNAGAQQQALSSSPVTTHQEQDVVA
jgi:hypothetical protein